MNEDDIQVLAFAEQNVDGWNLTIQFEGKCLIGCKGRKMGRTLNMLKAIEWADYHRHGAEHIGILLKNSGGDIEKLPEIKGNILLCENVDKETQP